MSSSPDLLSQRLHFRNWLDERRSAPAESVFLLTAGLSFAGIAVWALAPGLARLKSVVAALPDWLAIAAAAVLGASAVLTVLQRHAQLTQLQRGDWLAAQPIAATVRARFRHDQARLRGWLSALPGVALCAYVGWPNPMLATAALAAAAIAIPLALARKPRERPYRDQRSAASVRGASGLGILGASLEPAAARWPHTARFAAASLLLVPMGSGPVLVVALLLIATSLRALVDLIAHFAERLTESEVWLGAQPLAPQRLLAAFAPTLARRSALLLTIPLLALAASPAPLAWWPVAAVAAVLGTLHAVLLTHAERHHPILRRMRGAAHVVLLLLAAQILPPLALVAWLTVLFQLWRRRNV